MGSFVRRVTTASGATAVQIVHKRGRRVVGIDHLVSCGTRDVELLRLTVGASIVTAPGVPCLPRIV